MKNLSHFSQKLKTKQSQLNSLANSIEEKIKQIESSPTISKEIIRKCVGNIQSSIREISQFYTSLTTDIKQYGEFPCKMMEAIAELPSYYEQVIMEIESNWQQKLRQKQTQCRRLQQIVNLKEQEINQLRSKWEDQFSQNHNQQLTIGEDAIFQTENMDAHLVNSNQKSSDAEASRESADAVQKKAQQFEFNSLLSFSNTCKVNLPAKEPHGDQQQNYENIIGLGNLKDQTKLVFCGQEDKKKDEKFRKDLKTIFWKDLRKTMPNFRRQDESCYGNKKKCTIQAEKRKKSKSSKGSSQEKNYIQSRINDFRRLLYSEQEAARAGGFKI